MLITRILKGLGYAVIVYVPPVGDPMHRFHQRYAALRGTTTDGLDAYGEVKRIEYEIEAAIRAAHNIPRPIHLLHHRTLQDAFLKFAAENGSADEIEYLIARGQYEARLAAGARWDDGLRSIYDEYLSPTTPKEINLPRRRVRDELRALLDNPTGLGPHTTPADRALLTPILAAIQAKNRLFNEAGAVHAAVRERMEQINHQNELTLNEVIARFVLSKLFKDWLAARTSARALYPL